MHGIFEEILGSAKGVFGGINDHFSDITKGFANAPKSGYNRAFASNLSIMDNILDPIAHGAGSVAKTLGKGGAVALGGALIGSVGVALLGVGIASAGLAYLGGHGVRKVVQGIPRGGAFQGQRALSNIMGVESVARTILTGSPLRWLHDRTNPEYKNIRRGIKVADSWMPYLRNGEDNIKKYSINPNVVKRLTYMKVAAGLVAGGMELFNTNTPEATAYFDGRNIRQINDRGAHGGYGMNILNAGKDSNNMSQALIQKGLVHLF